VYLTPTVKAAVKRRNRLRRKVKTQRREWLEACVEVRKVTEEARDNKWREIVEGALQEEDERKVWSFIKSLNGSPTSNSPNEAIKVNGKLLTSSKKKADAFMNHYAEVSSLKLSKEDRAERRRMKQLLQKASVDGASGKPFTMRELDRALSKMKTKGAPGPDEIPPSFLKALGPLAKQELLEIFNASLEGADVPQIWRRAIIVPLLKAGKSPAKLASYRPISLTSCVVKLLERMIANRLIHLAETNGWFSRLQAGFRKTRSCEDQILKITQAIDDAFQSKPMKRSVLVLLDYSRAYDTVWRERLIHCMAEKGVPLTLLRWIASFLQDRQARVRYADTLSKNRFLKQGVPQGAVLSPILFLFYINSLAELLEKELPELDAEIALFADDVTILASDVNKLKAQETAQKLVDVVAEWSQRWKLTLNTEKSQTCFFTNSTKEAKWTPQITIDGKEIPFEKNPRLLGVILDRSLCFGPQVEAVTEQATAKLKILGALSFTNWGWRKDDLKKIYNAFVHSKLFYAGCGWMGWLSPTAIQKLQVVMNQAMRRMSGQYKASPVEALLLENRMVSVITEIERECARSYEKAMRLAPDHPRRETAEKEVAQRTERSNWRRKSREVLADLPSELKERRPMQIFQRAPWEDEGDYEVFETLEGVQSKNDPVNVIKEAAETRITALNPDIIIYTDGSADAGVRSGGAAAVITQGPPDDPTVTEVIEVKGAALTTSYEEEREAMERAVSWIENHADGSAEVLIVTDSQSLCKAIMEQNEGTDTLRTTLGHCRQKIKIQWIPGHAGVEGNECADRHAKAAAKLSGPGRGVSYQSAKSAVSREIREKMNIRPDIATTYSKMSKNKEQMIKSRADQVRLAQIRSGEFIAFGDYQKRLDNESDPICKRCKLMPDSVKHWLTECEASLADRQKIFGNTIVGLEVLSGRPSECVALSRKLGEWFN
jgi:ribonuclease HI